MKPGLINYLSECECCPRKCRVNRLAGQPGFCNISADVRISHAGLHFGEEGPISGTRGSGTIFFTGCNLRCVFCQNYQISQEFHQDRTGCMNIHELADKMLRLQDRGAHNINFVSPSHVILQMAEAIILARKNGLVIPVVYNSNGYDSVNALKKINGLIDIYLPDLKYLDNRPAEQFSSAPNYADIVPDVIREMLSQVGHLQMDENDVAQKGILVRHLVLPNNLENSKKCLDFLAELSTDIFLSIMSQYSPQYKACYFPPINRRLTIEEYDVIIDYALDLGLENAFIQEVESQDHYLPDFARDNPFNDDPTQIK